jgi:WhiB family redox-sensing transcriptional regulator
MTTLALPPAWTERALCAQVGGDIWFPEKGDNVGPAKKICRSCEVRAQCLTYALENEEQSGVWVGLTERELRAERHRGGTRPPEDVLAEADSLYFDRRRRASASQVRRLADEREVRTLKAKELAA